MKAFVVIESMFGNTRSIGSAVAAGLAGTMEVTTIGIGEVPAVLPEGIDLLVVGGPTHAFGLSRPSTRDSAHQQGAPQAPDIGVREWLSTLPGENVAAAAFDTRVDKRFVPGSAARGALHRLQELGFDVLPPACSFFVAGVEGPLRKGELDRARAWGEDLGRRMAEREAVGAVRHSQGR